MENTIIISCIFGTQFRRVHPSPNKKISFFFTNNVALENEIIEKGWNYVYVNKPLSNDIIISSLQSKYIKFLIFLEDYKEFKNKKNIIYFDHKENVSPITLNEINSLIKNNLNKSLIIRQTPTIKNNIDDEVKVAMGQSRYVENMDKTRDFIKYMVSSHGLSKKVRICNTGLLIYLKRENIQNLLKDVYEKCIEHQQPECQIYWSIFSQKYRDEIKEIKWTDIKHIQRKNPL